jgi:hypothetical protein
MARKETIHPRKVAVDIRDNHQTSLTQMRSQVRVLFRPHVFCSAIANELSLAGVDFTRDSRPVFTRDDRAMFTSHRRPVFTTMG